MGAISPGALLVCYLGLTTGVLLSGWTRVYAGGILAHVAILAAVAGATWTRGLPRWLRAWVPLFTLLFLYAEIPLLIRAIGHAAFYDNTVLSWEARLFHGQPAAEWAGRWPSRALSEALHLAYLSYYPVIFSVPVLLWFRGRLRDFGEAVFALLLTFIACFVWYLVFPVEGPRYLWLAPVGSTDGPIRAFTARLLQSHSSQGTAFPSSHVAVATAQAILAIRYFGWRGAGVAVLTAGLALGAIYGGFHYAVDVIAGVGVGSLVTAAALLVNRVVRTAPVQANASAPT